MRTLTLKKKKKNVFESKISETKKSVFMTIRLKSPKAGWGGCRSCRCTGFMDQGAGNMSCGDCGHHFRQHN